jgi:hypothetical protein
MKAFFSVVIVALISSNCIVLSAPMDHQGRHLSDSHDYERNDYRHQSRSRRGPGQIHHRNIVDNQFLRPYRPAIETPSPPEYTPNNAQSRESAYHVSYVPDGRLASVSILQPAPFLRGQDADVRSRNLAHHGTDYHAYNAHNDAVVRGDAVSGRMHICSTDSQS